MKASVEDDGSSDEDTPEQAEASPAVPPGLAAENETGRVHVTKSQSATDQVRRPQATKS